MHREDQTVSERFGGRNPHRRDWRGSRIIEAQSHEIDGTVLRAETYPFPTGPTLKTRCWCDYAEIEVDADLVRACMTESCGRPGCNPEMQTKRVRRQYGHTRKTRW